MPRTKPTAHKGPGGMILCWQLETRDASLPRVVSQKVVTNANLDCNEACMAAWTADTAVLSEIPNPLDCVVLKAALGRAFSAFDVTD